MSTTAIPQRHGFGAFPVPGAPAPAAIVSAPVIENGYGIPVYWPGDSVHVETFDNVDYVFQPRELRMIYASYRHQFDDKGRALMDRALEVKMAPDLIVRGLMQRASEKGLCAMMYDGRDDARKAEARALWVRWRLAECDRILADHEATCARAIATNGLPPRPSAAWRLAKHDSDRLQIDIETDRRRFVCLRDGMDFDTFEEASDYVRRSYPGVDAKTVIRDSAPNDPAPQRGSVIQEVAPAVPMPAQATAPVADSRLSQSDPDAVMIHAIFATAGSEGIAIPNEIREGMKSDDPELRSVAIHEARTLVFGPENATSAGL